jgi:hypothetical protein
MLEQHQLDLLRVLSAYESYDEGHAYPWANHLFRSTGFRRAHLDVVDARDTKKLYMMHLCILPPVHCGAPIYGFDLIAGPNKVTGAFHDFSPIAGNTALDHWFAEQVSGLAWSKPRELPDWARQIFSGKMVAAGNISEANELQKVLSLSLYTLRHYLDSLAVLCDKPEERNYTAEQNRYCHFQKQNPHTPKVMASLGFDADTVRHFIDECLFPEI